MHNTTEHKLKNETQGKTLKITIEAFTIPKYQSWKTSYFQAFFDFFTPVATHPSPLFSIKIFV